MSSILRDEAQKELGKQRTYQSDNGSELKNSKMRAIMVKVGVAIKHSRPYCPRTNGKVENRVKSIAKVFYSELASAGGLSGATDAVLVSTLASATAILNFRPASITTYSPYEVTWAAQECKPCTHD